jgi:hypothetical protein
MPDTVERVAVVEDLKYSVILAAGPEAAALLAAAASCWHSARAVRVAVSLVPVQSDWTIWRSARAWKARWTRVAAAPSIVVVRRLEAKGIGLGERAVELAAA